MIRLKFDILSIVAGTALLLSACACGRKHADTVEAAVAAVIQTRFYANPDSLFAFVKMQTDFGPRNPGSEAHSLCGDLIVGRLQSLGVDSVIEQKAPVRTADGKAFTARNILGMINPSAGERILLLAHYDTRPTADNDPSPSLRRTPISGANDGGSGVAVLMEIARLLGGSCPDSLGVDLLFVDMEDSGVNGVDGSDDTWCLGTQQWVKNMPYNAANKPRFGILFDMVGGRDAKFHREYFSDRSAAGVVNRVWATARESGFAHRFVNSAGGAVVDDHIHINAVGIPCIDIIESVNEHTGSFNPTWHTTSDNIDNIDAETMRVVTQTALNTLIKF